MLIHLASIEPLRKELQQFLCGPGNPIAGHLDHGIHHRSRALPGVSKICSDTDDFRLFRLSPVKIADFESGPIVNLSPVQQSDDHFSIVEMVFAPGENLAPRIRAKGVDFLHGNQVVWKDDLDHYAQAPRKGFDFLYS